MSSNKEMLLKATKDTSRKDQTGRIAEVKLAADSKFCGAISNLFKSPTKF